MTVNPSPSTLSNTVPTTIASNPATFVPTFTNTQHPPLPPPSTQQQFTYPGPTDHSSSAIPPPVIPQYNFAVPNPQQQYFQPVPPSLFADSQQQQPPFQFNPTANTYPNTFNAFSAPPPSSFQQPSRASPFTNDHHGHSHDHDGGGHGHSHDHDAGHGHSH